MKPQNEVTDSQIIKKIIGLRTVPERNPAAVASGRVKFLNEAKLMQTEAVSVSEKWRQTNWITKIQNIFQRKEQIPMAAIVTIITVIVLAFGGAGTVAASQSSLPDQPLYAVKTWSEDARLWLSFSNQSDLSLTQEFTDRRVNEIQQMAVEGKSTSEKVTERLRQELNEMLRLATNQSDQEAVQALVQVSTRLKDQIQTMDQAKTPDDLVQASLTRTREMLQEHLRLAEDGVVNPAQLRDQIQQREQDQNRDQEQNQDREQLRTGTADHSQTPGYERTQTPGNGNGSQDPSVSPEPNDTLEPTIGERGSGTPSDNGKTTQTPASNDQGQYRTGTSTQGIGKTENPKATNDPQPSCTSGSDSGSMTRTPEPKSTDMMKTPVPQKTSDHGNGGEG
jgi:hypothetical protein